MLLDDLEDRLTRRLEAAFATLRARMSAILARIGEKGGQVDSYDAQTLSDLESTIRRVRLEMRAAGLDDVLREVRDDLDKLRKDVLNQAGRLGLPDAMSGPTRQVVSALIGQGVEGVSGTFGLGASQIERYLAAAMVGGVRRSDLVLDIQRALESTLSRARTAASTALHSFHRQVTVRHSSEAGVEWFALLGPSDLITRPWCMHWVDHRGTPAMYEATGMKWGHAKQPHPVMAWGGGWGCRHRFVPLIGSSVDRVPVGPA